MKKLRIIIFLNELVLQKLKITTFLLFYSMVCEWFVVVIAEMQ